MPRLAVSCLCAVLALSAPAFAEDVEGAVEHGLVERFPGSDIAWQIIEPYLPYRIPVGPVTGYRAIGDWIETEGRVTRTFYRLDGTERGYAEVYLNYLDAFRSEGFEILAEGVSPDRKGVDVGSRQWSEVYFREMPFGKQGEVGTMTAGTASSGGAGAFVAVKDRAAGLVHVVVHVEQHSETYVGTLIDIVEAKPAETGLVAVNAEAIGRDLAEKGRVVLDGLFFGFDSAELEPRSAPALAAVAEHLGAHSDQRFFVVGHTDAKGGFDYNTRLSAQRAAAVVTALVQHHGIAPARLEAHGVGPLLPVFTNAEDAGRARNRRVELVEWPEG